MISHLQRVCLLPSMHIFSVPILCFFFHHPQGQPAVYAATMLSGLSYSSSICPVRLIYVFFHSVFFFLLFWLPTAARESSMYWYLIYTGKKWFILFQRLFVRKWIQRPQTEFDLGSLSFCFDPLNVTQASHPTQTIDWMISNEKKLVKSRGNLWIKR